MYLIWCHLLVIASKIAIHYINYNSSERRSVQHVCLRTSLQMRGSTSWARDKEKKIWFPDKTRIHDLPDTGWKRKTQSHVTERLGKLTFRFSHFIHRAQLRICHLPLLFTFIIRSTFQSSKPWETDWIAVTTCAGLTSASFRAFVFARTPGAESGTTLMEWNRYNLSFTSITPKTEPLTVFQKNFME